MITVKMKVLSKHVEIPTYKTEGAAAFDLAVNTAATLHPGQVAKLPTGLAFAIPKGYVGLIKSRSSSNLRGLRIDGVVDSDYRGEVFLIACNTSSTPLDVKGGERIAQMLIQEVPVAQLEVVEALDETTRGEGGFGSTGR